MNRPFDGFGFDMPELPKQLDKFFDEKASDYTNAKQAKIKKININYQTTRVKPEILDYIFKDFKNSENTEDYLKNLNVLFQQMKDKKYFQDIHLLNSYKISENIGQDKSNEKIQDQNQNLGQFNQETNKDLNTDINNDFSQKIQEIPEKIVEKAENLKENIKNELNINENEVELNIDAFIKDRKMFQSFIGPVNSLKSNILRGKAEIQVFNLFRNLEKISISANAAALQGFEKKQGRLQVKLPLFGHDMLKSVVYQTKITDKKLFSKNFMEMRQQNDINEHSFTHSIRFKPHNDNHDFCLVQQFRNNVYNNLQDRNQDNVESNQLKSQQVLRLDYTYIPKINIQYELLQNDKEQKDKKKKVIVNQIPESEKGETVVSKIFTSAQSLSISNRLLFNNSYSGQPAFQTKIQFQSQSYTKFSHHFKKLKTYGRFSFNNNSIATGLFSSSPLEVNDQLKIRNKLGFKEILLNPQMTTSQSRNKINLAFQNNLSIFIEDFPILHKYQVKPFLHFSTYFMPNLNHTTSKLYNQNLKGNNFNNNQRFAYLRKQGEKLGQSYIGSNIKENIRFSAGLGIEFSPSVKMSYNFFAFNGNKFNQDSFSKFQFSFHLFE